MLRPLASGCSWLACSLEANSNAFCTTLAAFGPLQASVCSCGTCCQPSGLVTKTLLAPHPAHKSACVLQPSKEVVRPDNQLQLTEKDLQEEIAKMLTANNPAAPKNLVRFNMKVDRPPCLGQHPAVTAVGWLAALGLHTGPCQTGAWHLRAGHCAKPAHRHANITKLDKVTNNRTASHSWPLGLVHPCCH